MTVIMAISPVVTEIGRQARDRQRLHAALVRPINALGPLNR
jgi:hypothetical protein